MVKTITIDGHVKDLAVIYRWAQNIIDDWITIKDYPSANNDLNHLVYLLGEYENTQVVKGINIINEVGFDDKQLYIEVDVYDNLYDLKACLERIYPWCIISIIENETE